MTSVRERVEQALALCRPYLQADGGDVELVDVTPDGIVELQFKGTCIICPMSRMTLRAGVERTVLRHAPEIKRVEAITPSA
ncbi:MAG: NifU family protein [Ignavibacteria bacterium]|nr:NifU family protein [Ignavibacteria bacterium]MBI3766409.1 NifU family protein [Ignavibacteriales bacterium]